MRFNSEFELVNVPVTLLFIPIWSIRVTVAFTPAGRGCGVPPACVLGLEGELTWMNWKPLIENCGDHTGSTPMPRYRPEPVRVRWLMTVPSRPHEALERPRDGGAHAPNSPWRVVACAG